MTDFIANYFVTINYKPKQGWGSPTSWDDVNKEIDDFMRRLTIELKGKKFWKRYAASGNERLIKGHGEIHFGITGEFPHAHIYLQKPDWCDDVLFVNAIHKIARLPILSKKDASAVDVRRCDYNPTVQEYGIREDKHSY